jgi:hypothetical protein
MAITLSKNEDIQTLALGYNYSASFASSDLSTSTGAQATNVTLGGSELAGVIVKAALIIDQLVSADVGSGSDVSNATIALGDDGDADGFVDEIDCFTGDSTEHYIFANNGVLLNGATSSRHVVSAVDVTSNGTTNGFGNASNGKFRIFLEYHPTAGTLFSS